MPTNKERITGRELTAQTDRESRDPDYIRWKREKIEAALRHADEHPDDFLEEKEVWTKFGIEY